MANISHLSFCILILAQNFLFFLKIYYPWLLPKNKVFGMLWLLFKRDFDNLFKSFSFVYNLIPKSFNEKIFTNLYFNLFKIKGKDYLSIDLENQKYSDLFSTLKVKDFLEFKYVISTLNLLRKSKSCINFKHKILF